MSRNDDMADSIAHVLENQAKYLKEHGGELQEHRLGVHRIFPNMIKDNLIKTFAMDKPGRPLTKIIEFFLVEFEAKTFLAGLCEQTIEYGNPEAMVKIRSGDRMELETFVPYKCLVRKANANELLVLDKLAERTEEIFYMKPEYGNVTKKKH